MKKELILYHDGCKICRNVVALVTALVDTQRYELTVINLEEQREYVAQASASGVKLLPSLIFEGAAVQIQPHANIAEFLA
jgi:predicted DCC family thiol-disulfide oxidoreductase YuxK